MTAPAKPFQETEEGVQNRIVERLAREGYVVEITSITRMDFRAGLRGNGSTGQTKGIGDLLVWRAPWYGRAWPGMKVNLETKAGEKYRFSSDEQRVSFEDGGIIPVWDEEMALEYMLRFDERVAQLLGVPVAEIRNTQGRVGHKNEALARKMVRDNEAREKARAKQSAAEEKRRERAMKAAAKQSAVVARKARATR